MFPDPLAVEGICLVHRWPAPNRNGLQCFAKLRLRRLRSNPESRMVDMLASDVLSFFRAWANNPLRVASITPSGTALARLITRDITTETGPRHRTRSRNRRFYLPRCWNGA